MRLTVPPDVSNASFPPLKDCGEDKSSRLQCQEGVSIAIKEMLERGFRSAMEDLISEELIH
jgi:hypothetical protein